MTTHRPQPAGRLGWPPFAWLAAGLLVFIETGRRVVSEQVAAWDQAIVGGLEQALFFTHWPPGSSGLREVVRDLTAFGGQTFVWLFLVGLAGYLALRRRWAALALTVLPVAAGIGLTFGLKFAFDRPRPEFDRVFIDVSTPSFPSGHTSTATILFLWLGLLLSQWQPTRLLRWYIFLFASALAVLVGASRILLQVHHPTDVLAGWAWALVWTMTCWIVARWFGWVQDAGTSLAK